MKNKNVFVYWDGPMPSLIPVLFETMAKYIDRDQLHILNDSNIKDYLTEIHPRYWDLSYTHKADYLRVNLVFEHGGIWLDADTLVREPLDGLFGLLKIHKGFFIKETESNLLCNGVFGARKFNKTIGMWADKIDDILDQYPHKHPHISRTEFGSKILNAMHCDVSEIFKDFIIFDGIDTIYPVNWDKCEEVYLSEDLTLVDKVIKKSFQEVIILVNSVYKALDGLHRTDLIKMQNVLGVLLRESLGDNYFTQSTLVCKKLRHTKTLKEYFKEFPNDTFILHNDKLAKTSNVQKVFDDLAKVTLDEETSIIYAFSVPDAFQSHKSYYYNDQSKQVIERVDPDHFCWYSPYTLTNLIRSCSEFKILKLLYVQDKLVAICEKKNEY